MEGDWAWPLVAQDSKRALGVVILGASSAILRPMTDHESLLIALATAHPTVSALLLLGDVSTSGAEAESVRKHAFRAPCDLAILSANADMGSISIISADRQGTKVAVPVIPEANILSRALISLTPDIVVTGDFDAEPTPVEDWMGLTRVDVAGAIELIGLHLRREGVFLVDPRASRISADKGNFYRLGAKSLLPGAGALHAAWQEAWRSSFAGGSDERTSQLLRVAQLTTSVEQRMLRALQARDRLRWGTDYRDGHADDVHLDLDSTLLALQGAVDASVRAVHAAVRVPLKGAPNWRRQDWVSALAKRWPDMADLYRADPLAQASLELLALLRNRIHSDTWGYITKSRLGEPRDHAVVWVSCEDEQVPTIRSNMTALGGRPRWQWDDISPTALHLEPTSVVDALIPATAAFLSSSLSMMAEYIQGQSSSAGVDSARRIPVTQAPLSQYEVRRRAAVRAQLGFADWASAQHKRRA